MHLYRGTHVRTLKNPKVLPLPYYNYHASGMTWQDWHGTAWSGVARLETNPPDINPEEVGAKNCWISNEKHI